MRAPLFDRGSHRLTLTAKGEQTLAFAYETAARVKELKDEHIPDGQLTGTVQINAGEWLFPQLKAAIDFFARPLSEYGESHRTCRG